MNRWIVALLVFFSFAAAAQTQSQTKDRWADWKPFLGTWQGTGTGQPGQGAGEFTLQAELQNGILVRRNYAEYPATKDKPAYRHDDLMVIYPDNEKTRADYWDNEAHVIHYLAEISAGKLVFTSDPAQPGPRFRLTYTSTTANDTLKILFEIAPPNDPSAFKTYIEASARRRSHQ
jgi:hypothetical protein